MGNGMVYLDNNATSVIAPEVIKEMQPFLYNNYGNPSSIYPLGVNVKNMIEESRNQVATLINAEPNEIVFTSGATEGNNTAIFSCIRSFPGKKHIITTAVEHSSIISTTKYLLSIGYSISYLPVDEKGRIDLEMLDKFITDDTILVSVMMVNNETGNIHPIEQISRRVKKFRKNILFHTDAVQAIGKVAVDVKNSCIDLLTLSGHKFHAPKGVGAMYIKKDTPFVPYIFGGHQERGLRGGTENTASVIALGKAAELVLMHQKEENEYVRGLRDTLENSILKNIACTYVYGDVDNRVPNTTNIGFDGIKGEEILLHLAQKSICVSTGSACNSVSIEPSHVLRAMQIPESRIRSIRFSLSRYNTESDVEYLLTNLYNCVSKLRKIKEKRKNVSIN